ncbi:YgaP family membrane protein [Deinococcus fonticola]|uniref:YgaP family membrane protein n=1 Tax=Deinococcus fonticola TaxID=2528713 RepID=UPI0010755D68|nr:DUF2892 domain-containing protein [Deinococcus fonticola]
MKANEGSTDRYLRIGLSLFLFALALMTSGLPSTILWVLGTVALITGLSGFCLVYRLLGMNTCKR